MSTIAFLMGDLCLCCTLIRQGTNMLGGTWTFSETATSEIISSNKR
jgi:hypothetical protein